MRFIYKILKELNSAENEKFITLAVLLGLISGFLPFFNIFTLIILFAAFVIRIPFGLYLASWGVFSVIGYFLDPLFASTGYAVLNASFLSPLWEFFYNIPLMRWSGFNNTVVMGGLIWGIAASILLYFFLNKSISLYREKLFSFCAKYKYLKWIIPNNEKKKSIFRLSGLISFAVIFGAIFLSVSIMLDPVIKKVTEYSLSKILHKNVKIDKLDTSFIHADLKIKGLHIGNTVTDSINVKLSWYYLLWRKFDIEKLIIKNIHTQKSIRQLINPKKENSIKVSKNNKSFKINLPDPNTLIASYKLESVQKIKKLKNDYKEFILYTKSLKNNIAKTKKEIKSVKEQIKILEKTSKHIKSVNDIQKILTQTNTIKKEIKTIEKSSKNEKNRLSAMKKQILNDLNDIKKAADNDYKNLEKKYNMIKSGEYYKFAQSFLKPEIQNYINQFMKYYNILKPYLKSGKNKQEYIRSRGVYIKFKDKIKYPQFVLKKGEIDAKTKYSSFSIILKDISSNQALLNKKAVIRAVSVSKYYKKAFLQIVYLNKAVLNYYINNIHLNDLAFNKAVLKDVNIDIKGEGGISSSHFNITSKAVIKPQQIEIKTNQYAENILKKIKMINLNIKISGTFTKYSIEVNSDIDKKLSKYIQKELQSQIEKSKKRLKAILDEKINKEIASAGIKTDTLGIDKNLDNINISVKMLDKTVSKYTKKELEKKILKKNLGKFIKF